MMNTAHAESGLQSQRGSRPRNARGCFISSAGSGSEAEALLRHKKRQLEYRNRRKVAVRRILNSFVRSFVVMNQDDSHWVPGSMEDNPFQDLFLKLVKEGFQGSKQSRLGAIKTIYRGGDIRRKHEVLPRRRTRDADKPHAQLKRVPMLSGWRFPVPINDAEMEPVHSWLRENRKVLKIRVEEGIGEALRTFSSYKRQGGAYFYSGFPSSDYIELESQRNTHAAHQPASFQPQVSTLQAPQVSASHGPVSAPGSAQMRISAPEYQMRLRTPIEPVRIEDGSNQQRTCIDSVGNAQCRNEDLQPGDELNESELGIFSKRVIGLAFDDSVFRSFQLLLEHQRPAQIAVVCALWVSSFQERPPAHWIGLKRQFYDFCRLIAAGKTQSEAYRNIKMHLSDQLELFKIVRKNSNLPLFEESPWPSVPN